ncbi:MAG: hypothetical protein P1R58_05240 [bacterium]|nr:hypothetical protein [bacterium]
MDSVPRSHVLNLVDDDLFGGSQPSKLICKFVLLNNGRGANLVFGPLDNFPYHANLVDQFCIENNIAATWERKPDLVAILQEDWLVQGGGWMEIDPISKQMKFFGRSTAYGRFDPALLNQVLTEHTLFSPYHITVRH